MRATLIEYPECDDMHLSAQKAAPVFLPDWINLKYARKMYAQFKRKQGARNKC